MLMKKIFWSVFLTMTILIGADRLAAQTAVLQHEGELSTFYGSDSFIEAYNTAVDGDVITLSEGTFNTCNIGKSITIHGAGAYEDSEAGILVTRFNSTIYVIGDCSPTIEGVEIGTVCLSSTNNASFVKCKIFVLEKYSSASVTDVHLINCVIKSLNICNTSGAYIDNLHVVNSVIWNIGSQFAGQNHIASNSIIRTDNTNSWKLKNIIAYNSVIVNDSPFLILESTCTIYNCIGVGTSVFANSLNSNVMEVDVITDVFPTYDASVGAEDPFILDEGIANSFLGTDGTEVGIHGGYYPYSNRPGYMKVRHCTVADRTTDDGQLSVDIEVVTEE